MLLEQIESAKLEQAEAAVALQLAATMPTAISFSESDRTLIEQFVQWCGDKGVRYCPARPATVASFILETLSQGTEARRVIAIAGAIENLHDYYSVSNPVATSLARTALALLSGIPAPRSWAKDEKVSFAMLPPDIQAVIARREADRETIMRKAQNEIADLRRAAHSDAANSKKED